MDVLAFGSYDAQRHPRIAVLLEGLSAHGVTVQECNVPLDMDTAARVRVLRQPWRLPVLALRLLRTWAALTRRARALPPPDVVLVGYLGHFDVLLARLLFPSATVVHDMLVFASGTARDRGAGGLVQRLLRWLDRAAIACSDLVVVDTDEHADLLPSRRRGDAVVVPVGAPRRWLAAEPVGEPVGEPVEEPGDEPVASPSAPLRVVFYGLFTPLQGTPTLGRALALLADRPDLQVHLIGSGQDLERCRQLAGDRPEVTWQTWVPGDELPQLVAAHDVCLGIFGTSDKARRVVPNKVFQGAAAGCAIVTSDTPPQRRCLGDGAVLVPPGDAVALADALRALADDRERVLALRRAAWQLAHDRFLPETAVLPLHARLSSRTPTAVSLESAP